ncbi:ribulose-bisphosphate carboxylase [Magnetospira sp. QH-2]|uniref:ribulose-bisphosphate carboxylase n=1 Tax=Magnetospira sp. (strain QH-2) TaxID=1288970 RepID=UPI0003E80AB3|nr:ribulose-bisphosphate carboxylase [Magnetospira sp. QH-2]CCQ74996.1 Ribulose bisphosphate carboxylase [Magnetospira sp. QH-2]
MDQSNRYADLSLKEEDLLAGGGHVLVAYIMKPKQGYGYLEAAAHFAAESSTGTNVEVSTTDDFTKGVDALVYEIDEAKEIMKIAYPCDLFDRNITDGRAMLVSFLTLAIGNNQGMGDIEYAKIHDFYVPPAYLRLFDGPSKDISDMWRILGRPIKDGGYIAGTIIKPKLGLRPEPFAAAAYQFWLGGDFIKNDEPQGNQVFCPAKKVYPLVYDAMKRAMDETGQAKLFSANITADDHYEMLARGEFILEAFGPDADKVAFLVDGYVGGPGMVTTARRNFPNQYLHYHRAGHGAVTSPSAKRGYTAFVLAKMSRMQGASGIHVGTMGFGKMEGENDDRNIAYMIERDSADGPFFHQEWEGMKPTTPIISGGMNALRLPGFFENLGHGNVINTSGGGSYGHIDSPAAGAISLRQAYECWKAGADPIEWAKEHHEFARAFESFPGDADQIFPGWRDKLGVHK